MGRAYFASKTAVFVKRTIDNEPIWRSSKDNRLKKVKWAKNLLEQPHRSSSFYSKPA